MFVSSKFKCKYLMCAKAGLSGEGILLTMGLFQVVLAAVTDVQDVRDLQHVYDLLVFRVVPVSEPQAPGQDFVRISLGNGAAF